jgi:hypothetical protein
MSVSGQFPCSPKRFVGFSALSTMRSKRAFFFLLLILSLPNVAGYLVMFANPMEKAPAAWRQLWFEWCIPYTLLVLVLLLISKLDKDRKMIVFAVNGFPIGLFFGFKLLQYIFGGFFLTQQYSG